MIYTASRVHHAPLWRKLRETYPIISTWIDEDGEGESNFKELWPRIGGEIYDAQSLVLYVKPDDFPLKGAFIEVGMALALGKPVFVAAHGVKLEGRTLKPLGSWLHHPLVSLIQHENALEAAMTYATPIYHDIARDF